MCGDIDSTVEVQVAGGGDDLVGWGQPGAGLGDNGASVTSESGLWLVQIVQSLTRCPCDQGTGGFARSEGEKAAIIQQKYYRNQHLCI